MGPEKASCSTFQIPCDWGGIFVTFLNIGRVSAWAINISKLLFAIEGLEG